MLAPLAALILQWLLWPLIRPSIWVLFYPAVYISSWIGGVAAGLGATIFSVVVVWWFFIEPQHSFVITDLRHLISVATFVATGVLFSLFHARLRRSEQSFRDLFNLAADGVFIADLEGRYTDVNDAGCRMLGYAREELVGKTIVDLIPAADADRLWQAKDQLLKGGVHVAEWVLRRKNGSYLPVEVSAKILPDGRWQGLVRDISERRRTEQLLRENAELINDLYNNAPCGYHSLDKDGVIVQINDTELRWLGYSRDEVIGKLKFDKFLTIESQKIFLENFPRLKERGWVSDLEFDFVRKDGSTLPVLLSATAIKDADGRFLMSRSILFDHSQRRQAETQLRQAAIVFGSTNEAVMITDAKARLVTVNAAFTAITGYRAEEMVGKNPRLLNSGRQDDSFFQEMWAALQHTGQWQGEIWNRRKNGEIFPAWENISVVKDARGAVTHYVSVFSDISAIKGAEERLHHLAHHDVLTNLPNRLLFTASLEKSLERAKRHQQKLALLFLDLDRFKLINDTMGHTAGDQLLKEIGRRLLGNVRAQDTVARLGGDEFTVVYEEILHAEEVAHLAGKIITEIAQPVSLDGKEVVISASIGIAVYPDDADSAEGLTKSADAAMYRAKERGRNRYEFYTPEITALALERLSLENGLRRALSHEELELYYQPQMEVATGRITGVEALLRWRHPVEGLILPERFIRVAEESGLITVIGDWVIRQALKQRRRWLDQGLPPLRIAINVSVGQIVHDHLPETMQAALRESGIQPGDARIELEITESVMQTMEQSAGVLRRLRALGIRIAIDDFGTGYSSLSLLKHLPIDTLKIDRLFVRNVPDDTDSRAIAAAMISMAHTLGLHVVAEGVETEGQFAFLRERGCDEAQGHLLGAAAPAEVITRMLEKYKLRADTGGDRIAADGRLVANGVDAVEST